MRCIRSFDPARRSLLNYTRSLNRCLDYVAANRINEPSPLDAATFLNKLGVGLTSALMDDFEHIMGIDLAQAQIVNAKVPVNELTWMEICRVVLLSGLCREVGMSDVDIAALIKGRGFVTTPESADRKTLKLARRRILFAYTVRHENQESLYGFGSGNIVCMPTPGNPPPLGGVMWTELVSALYQIDDKCGWLIHEIILSAAVATCIIDSSPSAQKLKRNLLECIDESKFSMGNAGLSKAAALRILQQHTGNSLLSKRNGSSINGDDDLEAHGEIPFDATALFNRLKLIYRYREKRKEVEKPEEHGSTFLETPSTTLELWSKQMHEAIRYALEPRPGFSTIQSSLSIVGDGTANSKSNFDSGDTDGSGIAPILPGTTATVVAAPVSAVTDDNSDAVAAEVLPLAMQRCYIVLKDLMNHPQAQPFCQPVSFHMFYFSN